MTEQEFQDKINKSLAAIDSLPEEVQPGLIELVRETVDRHRSIQTEMDKARIAAIDLAIAQDDLKLALTYLRFDAECVARELRGKNEQA